MKTVIITGASHGLGSVIADVFLKSSWHVIGTGRSERPDVLDSAIQYEQFDASNAAACTDFWSRAKGEFSEEVCLVNNAGGYVGGGVLETQPEDYEKQMMSNYFSGVYMTRGLVESVQRARIINVISNGALVVRSKSGAYGASKAAAMHYFQSFQKEFDAQQYQVTNLYPSDIASHGPSVNAIDPSDLAQFILQQAENHSSFYIPDVTLYAVEGKRGA